VVSRPEKSRMDTEYCRHLLILLLRERVAEKIEVDIVGLRNYVKELRISSVSKLLIYQLLDECKAGIVSDICKDAAFAKRAALVAEIYGCGNRLLSIAKRSVSVESLQEEFSREIVSQMGEVSSHLLYAVSHCLMREIVTHHMGYIDIYEEWRAYAEQKIKAKEEE